MSDELKLYDELKPYEQRFIREYYELVQKMNRLEWIIAGIESCTVDFMPRSDLQDLREQLLAMRDYRHVLMKRACTEELASEVREFCNE